MPDQDEFGGVALDASSGIATDEFGGVSLEESPAVGFHRMPAAPLVTNLAQALAVPPLDVSTPEQWGQQMAMEQRARALPITAPLDQVTTAQVAGDTGTLVTLPEAPSVEQAVRLPGEAMLGGMETESLFGPQAADVQVQVQRSLYNAAKSLPEFATTEEGMLAGLASLTPLGRLGVEAYFTYDMAKSVLDQAKKMGEDWDQSSTLEKANRITQAIATLGFTGLLAKAGVGTMANAIPKRPGPFQGPLATGEILVQPPGAPVPRGIVTAPEIVSPDVSARRAMQTTLEATGEPFQRFPKVTDPTAPTTPAQPERGLTVLEEIRQAGARTTAQVQALFPDRGLTREEAADLRRKAWGQTKPTVTDTTPVVPPGEMPDTPTVTGLYPAVREIGGKVDVGEAGQTHPEIIKEHKLEAEDIDQRGFVNQQGQFLDREQAAAATPETPTVTEPERRHSTDLPEATPEELQRELDKELEQEPGFKPTQPETEPAAPPKPEVASVGGSKAINRLVDPQGTTYHATPEDWARWQELQSKPLTEEGVWTEREQIKNKYGGMPPEPPRSTATPSAETKAKEPWEMTAAEYRIHEQRGTWAQFTDEKVTEARNNESQARKALDELIAKRKALGNPESIRKVMTDRDGALKRNQARRDADKEIEAARKEFSKWASRSVGLATHEGYVKRAIEAGKPVPPEVLADYPDLQPKAPPVTPSQGAPPETAPATGKAPTHDVPPAGVGEPAIVKGKPEGEVGQAEAGQGGVPYYQKLGEQDAIDPTRKRMRAVPQNFELAYLDGWYKAKKSQTEPPAAAKFQAEVAKVAKTEGQRSAKEVKSELVQRLEKAIEEAPLASEWDMGKPPEGKPEKLTINIPGDGDFFPVNTKEAISEVLKRAKRISTSTTSKATVPQSAIKASEKALQHSAEERERAVKQKASELKGKARIAMADAINQATNEGIIAYHEMDLDPVTDQKRMKEWRIRRPTTEERTDHWKANRTELGWIVDSRIVKLDEQGRRQEGEWGFSTEGRTRADAIRSAEHDTIPPGATLTDEGLKNWRHLENETGPFSYIAKGEAPPKPEAPKPSKPAKETDDQFLKRITPRVEANDKTITRAERKRYNELTKGKPTAEGGVRAGPEASASLVNPPPEPLPAFSGIPLPEIPRAITDQLRKSRDTLKTYWQTRDVRDVMTWTKDAVDAANLYGQRVGNDIRGNLRRAMNRGTKPSALDENALSFVREADDDPAQLAVMRAKLVASTKADPKWRDAAVKAIDHAEANWPRLNSIAQQYALATDRQVAMENAAGINTLSRPGYVMHAQDVESDFGFFGRGGGEDATGFRHARAHDTFADSIAAGVDPKSLNAVTLLAQRVAIGQRLINNRMWVESLRATTDPQTGKSIVTEPEVVSRGPGLPPDIRAPRDYVTEIAGGRPIAILKSYSGTFKALTEPSKFSESLGWNMALKSATTGKSIALMIDTFHLGRLAFWESIIKPLSFTDPKLPLPSYKRGVLTLDYSAAELTRMANAGEINPAHLPELLRAQRDVNGLVKHGYNVSKIVDMLHQEWMRSVPVIGSVNRFIFDLFQRGAMAEVGAIEVPRYRRMHPSWNDDQVYRAVAKDLNARFGNLGRQGALKSRTAQDMDRIVFLAPQWNEGLIRSEIGALSGAVRGVAESVKERRPAFGVLPRAVGGMLLAQFAANQIINYATRGHPTWQNEEDGLGAKLSAWIPDLISNGPGFFLHPAGLAAEVTHLLSQKYSQKGDFYQAMMAFLGGRWSTLARPAITLITRRNIFQRLIRPENVWRETAAAAIPSPIGASAAVPAIKGAITGESTEPFPGAYQRQIMSSFGVKTDLAESPGRQIMALADHWKKAHGITDPGEFYESAYAPLRSALQRGASKEARRLYLDLLANHTRDQIEKAIRPWTGGTINKSTFEYSPRKPKPLTGSARNEAAFLATLTPRQKLLYQNSLKERRQQYETFLAMIRQLPPPDAFGGIPVD